jgi:hypothetical protein
MIGPKPGNCSAPASVELIWVAGADQVDQPLELDALARFIGRRRLTRDLDRRQPGALRFDAGGTCSALMKSMSSSTVSSGFSVLSSRARSSDGARSGGSVIFPAARIAARASTRAITQAQLLHQRSAILGAQAAQQFDLLGARHLRRRECRVQLRATPANASAKPASVERARIRSPAAIQ